MLLLRHSVARSTRLSGRSRAAETGRDGAPSLPRASVQVPEQHDWAGPSNRQYVASG